MKAYEPPIKPYATYNQAELRRLLAIDAAAHNARTKAAVSQESITHAVLMHRANVAERTAARNRRIQDSRDMMDAEVLGLISAGAETIADIWYAMAGREVKRPSIERAVASLCADGRIQANGRASSGARIWKVAA